MSEKSFKNKKWLVDSLYNFEPTEVVNNKQNNVNINSNSNEQVDKNTDGLKSENFESNVLTNLANDIKTGNIIKTRENISSEILIDAEEEFVPKIKVFGVGGAGNNVVDYILSKNSMISFTDNTEFYALNTDKQHLLTLSNVPNKSRVLISSPATRGLGSGGDPKLGEQATLDFADNIKKMLENTDLCIVIAGVGKGTGTGGGPVVVNIARSMNISTLALVITPNNNEGNVAFSKARIGLTNFQSNADAVATISNDLIDRNNNPNFSVKEIREQINKNIGLTVHSLVNMIVYPSYQNIDLADIKSFLKRKKNVNRLIHLSARIDSSNDISKIQTIIDEKVKVCVYGQNLKMINKVLIQFNLNGECSNELIKKVVSKIRELVGNSDIEVVIGLKFVDKMLPEQIDIFAVSPDLAANDIEEVHHSARINKQDQITNKMNNKSSYTINNIFDNNITNNNVFAGSKSNITDDSILIPKKNLTGLQNTSISKFKIQNDELDDSNIAFLESHSIIEDNDFDLDGLEVFDKDTTFDFDTDSMTKMTHVLKTAIPRRQKSRPQFDDDLLTFSETSFKN